MFTSKKKDKKHFYLKDNPICIVAPNIASFAGGGANLWGAGLNKSGLHNPYVKKGTQTTTQAANKKKLKQILTAPQKFDDDKLEFTTLYSIIGMGLGRSKRVG